MPTRLSKAKAIKQLRSFLRQARQRGAQADALIEKYGSMHRKWPSEIRQEINDLRNLAIFFRDCALKLQHRYDIGHRANWEIWKAKN